MKTVIHRAESRGVADHGWLQSRHTFSFADYMNHERMQFGALRVLNDDTVAPGMGFGRHGHADMEIVSIPITGSLAHKDSTGREETILTGDVQIMSAGTGIMHSEFNPDEKNPVNFLQIWILPEKRGIAPRYGQKSFDLEKFRNNFVRVVSAQENGGALWINQQAEFQLGLFDAGVQVRITRVHEKSGLYVFVIEGGVEVAGEKLKRRDAIGIADEKAVDIVFMAPTRLLTIEVPV